MQRLIKFFLMFMGVFLLVGCNSPELLNDIETSNNFDVIENKTVKKTDSNNVLSEVILEDFFVDYTYISQYGDRTFGYNKSSNTIDVIDSNQNVMESWTLNEHVNLYNFEAISYDEIIFCQYYTNKDIDEIKIYKVNKESMVLVFDSKDVDNKQFGLIKELTMVNDVIYLIDSTNVLKRIQDGEIDTIPINGLAIDVLVDDQYYYVLSEELLSIFDKSDKLINAYEINELTALELVKTKANHFYIVCTGKLLYTENFVEFSKLELDNHRFSYTYQNTVCIDEDSLIILDEDKIKQFKIIDREELMSNKEVISVAINTLDTSFPSVLKQIKSPEFDLKIVYYDKLTADEFSTKMSADLLTGNAPDLIVTQGSDFIQDFVDSNAFYDLNLLIKDDSTFDIDLYEESLINASMDGEEFYTFPMSYFPDYVCINKQLMEQLDISLDALSTWEGIYNTYININEDLDNPSYYIGTNSDRYEDHLSYLYTSMFSGDILNFIDFDEKTAQFDSEEFIEISSKMKVVYIAQGKSPISMSNIFSEFDSHNNNVDLEKHLLYTFNIQNGYQYREVYDHGDIKLPMVKGYSSNQRYNENYFGSYISINKDAENINVAWQVLKMIISYESEWNYSKPGRFGGVMGYGNFGISTKANEEKVANYLEYLSSDDYREYLQLAKENKLLRGNDINTDILSEEKIEILENILRAESKIYFKSSFDKVVIDELRRYFDEEILAEELAESLQNKAELYLGE